MVLKEDISIKPSRSKVFAVTSGKGGVGKTFISVNLSVLLSKAGANVLLIDADMGLANVDIMTGVSTPHTIEEVINGDASIFASLADGPEGITILPAGSGLGTVQEFGPEQKRIFRKEFLKLESAFDFIIIDTGAGISANVVDFVFMADEVIVVMTPEPTAFADAYAMVKLVSIQKPKMNIGVIVNIVNDDKAGQEIATKFNEIVMRFLEKSVDFRGTIITDKAVSEAVIRQTPLVQLQSMSPSIKSLRRIAKNLLSVKKTNKTGLFNR